MGLPPRVRGVRDISVYKKGTTESTQDPENSRNAPKPKVPYIDLNISQFLNYGNGNSSKIVDENGEPLVVYHGGTFAVNDDNNIASSGMHFGTKKAALDRIFADKLIQQEADKVKVKEVVAPQPFMTGEYEYSYNGYTIKEQSYIEHHEGDDWYYFPDKIKEKIREKIFYKHGSAGISLKKRKGVMSYEHILEDGTATPYREYDVYWKIKKTPTATVISPEANILTNILDRPSSLICLFN